MRIAATLLAIGAVLLIGSCQFPLSTPNSATATLKILNTGSISASDSSRALVAENSKVTVSVTTNGRIDSSVSATAGSDSTGNFFVAKIFTSVGLHSFIVDTFDLAGNRLTHGETSATLSPGNNALTINLNPTLSLTLGQSLLLQPGQLAYVSISDPVSRGVVLGGFSASLWECLSNGSFGGVGTSNLLSVSLTAGVSKIMRVQQGASAARLGLMSQSLITHSADWIVARPGDPSEQDNPSLALDPAGNLYLSYSQDWNIGEVVQKYDGTSWSVVGTAYFTGPLSGTASSVSPIAVDSSGTPFLAYNSPSGTTVSMYVAPNWVPVSGLSGMTGGYVSLAIDPVTNQPAVLCALPSGNASVLEYNGSTWAPIGGSPYSGTSISNPKLLFAPSGVPFVAYQDSSAVIRVLKFTGTWTAVGPSITATGSAYDIALDTSGVPYLVYAANVVKFNGSTWSQVGGANFTGVTLSNQVLTIASGQPCVAFVAPTGLTTMRFNGSSWVNAGTPYTSGGIIQDNALISSLSGILFNSFGDSTYQYGQRVRSF